MEESLASSFCSQVHKYKFDGIEVSFPYKAYPSQESMMKVVINSIMEKRNCLLESPTGSGKTLALLCSALAWQQKQLSGDDEDVQQSSMATVNLTDTTTASSSFDASTDSFPPSSDNNCSPAKLPRLSLPEEQIDTKETAYASHSADQKSKSFGVSPSKYTKKPKVPKIYFGTRTHTQIKHIISELKQTSYANVKMSVLSSRKYSCIHPDVSKAEDKKEACEELIYDERGSQCEYYPVKNITHQHPKSLSKAWDIEDLTTMLQQEKACPYYAAKSLAADSEIIFCHYNYLVNPNIRSALDIDLTNSIIIMDYGHNLENSAREAVSQKFEQSQLRKAIKDLNAAEERGGNCSYHQLSDILTKLDDILIIESSNLRSTYEDISGIDIREKLWASVGVRADNFSDIQQYLLDVIEQNRQEKRSNKLATSTLLLLKNFVSVLSFIYEDGTYESYRLVIQKKSVPNDGYAPEGHSTTELSIHFCCLNPAVAFFGVKNKIHNIIVVSATLAPLEYLQSELGICFHKEFRPDHVVPRYRVWVGAINSGPNLQPLRAAYSTLKSDPLILDMFQKQLGFIVLNVCSIIPYGVLCFLPSYAMLEYLAEVWEDGMLKRLRAKKRIVFETRDQSNLEEFYEGVKGGAVLFAVFRGKVSEGIDFADNNARAVIAVGIPFPNIEDFHIKLKKDYNNSLYERSGHLSGNYWYDIHAFQALNQALGRCIRHRADFGALILVDERFQEDSVNHTFLSKWIQNRIRYFDSFSRVMFSLSKFADTTGLAEKIIDGEDKVQKLWSIKPPASPEP